jgi:hypothetical protein
MMENKLPYWKALFLLRPTTAALPKLLARQSLAQIAFADRNVPFRPLRSA